MTRLDRITVDPARMNGQPTIRNTRNTVARVLEVVGRYQDREELRQEFPELDDEDVRQALDYAVSHQMPRSEYEHE